MSTQSRIAWLAKNPGPGVQFNDRQGFAPGFGAHLFTISAPMREGGEWMLASYLPGQTVGAWYCASLDEAKAEAEQRLTEFVASLGAVFPEGK